MRFSLTTEKQKAMASRSNQRNIFRLIEAATNEAPPEKSFVADLSACIEKMDSDHARKPSRSYKPSSMLCIRNMYFQITGAEMESERASYQLVGISESGTDRHERIQNAVASMADYGMECVYVDVEKFIKSRGLDHLKVVSKNGFETKLYHTGLNMSFMCDGIIKYRGQYYILEIKTETSFKWQSRTGIADEHVTQGTAYSVSFGIDQVMFLYENRDTCDKKAYILEVTDDMKFSLVVGRIEECDEYVSRLIPPPKPENVPKKACTYCNYRVACRKAGA